MITDEQLDNWKELMREATSHYAWPIVSGLIDDVERMRKAIRIVLENPTSHYGHSDNNGTAGANCPACRTDACNRQLLRSVLP